jgi:REP element-mobilizing transposase RayT
MAKDWNDTGVPKAYLITFRCYGTWLHGDARGSVDGEHNAFGAPTLPENSRRQNYVHTLLKGDPVRLDAKQRGSVEKAIRETCKIRGWKIYALNVRTNHVHVVVDISTRGPAKVLVAFKANSTRQMRTDGCWTFEHSPWVENGSTRYLWLDEHLERAIDYVNFGQGDDLSKFE